MEIMEALLFPDVSFYGESFTLNNDKFMILGKIKFHSIYKEINVSGDWDQTKERIILKGGFSVKPSDFDIKLPDFMLVKMENNLEIEYELIFQQE